jgi:hypothetical protein
VPDEHNPIHGKEDQQNGLWREKSWDHTVSNDTLREALGTTQ